MAETETLYKHIVLNESKIPIIAGTTMKVTELVLNSHAYGWSPEELHFQHPYLTLGQIHSALAYYWDHQKEIEEDIQRRKEQVKKIQSILEPSSLQKRIKEQRLK
ncbi:MAG TPA: DUF433 domain-containing protein [Thermodesulfovibrionia bacterium]|nr:DUF433 domain-containing protein [Thermodesulfovibrionia bacterium]